MGSSACDKIAYVSVQNLPYLFGLITSSKKSDETNLFTYVRQDNKYCDVTKETLNKSFRLISMACLLFSNSIRPRKSFNLNKLIFNLPEYKYIIQTQLRKDLEDDTNCIIDLVLIGNENNMFISLGEVSDHIPKTSKVVEELSKIFGFKGRKFSTLYL